MDWMPARTNPRWRGPAHAGKQSRPGGEGLQGKVKWNDSFSGSSLSNMCVEVGQRGTQELDSGHTVCVLLRCVKMTLRSVTNELY